MSTLSGSVHRGSVVAHYSVRYGPKSLPLPLCSGSIYQHCGIKGLDAVTWINTFGNAGNNEYTFAWGYDGSSPELLAVTLLALALNLSSTTASIGHVMRIGWVSSANHKDMDLVKKHYHAFTSEVIADLPDTWTMTVEEIEAWIKRKEEQCGK